MAESIRCDVCVIGAGSAGLTVAFAAARLRLRTVLFEQHEMGGECLNSGCVPSKSMIAAARAAAQARSAAQFGVKAQTEIDFAGAMQHVQRAIAAIAPHDFAERFVKLGVRVIRSHAQFTGPKVVSGGGVEVRARRFAIATGSRPAIPAIPGIDQVPFLTNETIFSLRERPSHLLIIGGGPAGIEMAQAFARLGSRVTVFEAARMLSKDEPELVDGLRRILVSDGIALREYTKIAGLSAGPGGPVVTIAGSGETIAGSHLLIATGRAPNVENLGLDKADVAFGASGINVNARLRTRNRKVFAAGDVAGGPQFTHVASHQAEIVIRNALFGLPARTDYRALPWVTYTDPELAHVGMTLEQARARYGRQIRVMREDLAENDRAQTDCALPGEIRVIARTNGEILGASILAPHSGELIQLWALAITNRLKLKAITKTILPYPTLGEISKTAALSFYLPKLFSGLARAIVRIRLMLP